jgi:GT2 family glycosyltransferase
MPEISVIITGYSTELYQRRCLNSVGNQALAVSPYLRSLDIPGLTKFLCLHGSSEKLTAANLRAKLTAGRGHAEPKAK